MADDYTPTTEQVRDGYAKDPLAEYNNPLVDHAHYGRLAFDRWLAAHDVEVAEKARADERERIAAAIEREGVYLEHVQPEAREHCRGYNEAIDDAARIARTPDPNGDNT